MFEKRQYYSRAEIHAKLGGSIQSYLPTVNNKIVATCLKRENNPKAPNIVLPGLGKIICKAADQFAKQGNAVPTFIKKCNKCWEYVGMYHVKRQSHKKDEIDRYAKEANRINKVSSVLFMDIHNVTYI